MRKVARIICILMCSIMAFSLSACSVSEKDVTYVEDGFTDETTGSDAELLKNYDALSDFITNTAMSEEMYGKLSAYTKDFFNNNMLVVISHWDDKGASFIEVDDVDYEGNWAHVELDRRTSDAANASKLKNWGIIVEIKKDDNLTSASYSIE